MTVRHNGVVVHDNVELPHSTTAAPVAEGPQKGPLYLQDHGNPVRFRNIWLVEK
jgi:3-keto-disaccharide hydrolase